MKNYTQDIGQFDSVKLYFKDLNDIPDFRSEDDVNKFKEFSSSVGELKQLMIENTLCYKNGKTYSSSEIQNMKLSELKSVKYRFVNSSEKSNLELQQDIVKKRDYCINLRNAIIVPHLRLVVSCANEWISSSRNNLSLSDLIQYGNEGLINAAELFDYNNGNKFNTYATSAITRHISRGIEDFSEVIVLPVPVQEEIRLLKKRRNEFLKKNSREPNRTELFELSGLNEKKFNNSYRALHQRTYSLDVILEDNMSLTNIIPDKKAQAALESISESIAIKQEVCTLLAGLDERERKILEEKYGINDGIPKTYGEIAPIFNMSIQRIARIEHKALDKLRNVVS